MMVARYKNPTNLIDLRQSVESICRKYKVPDPARFLASLMSGIDPRPVDAPIKQMIQQIVHQDSADSDVFKLRLPDEHEWKTIVAHVLKSGNYEHDTIGVQESLKAAQKLMDFLHKQQKSSVSDSDVSTLEYHISEITEDDVKRVKEIFDDVF